MSEFGDFISKRRLELNMTLRGFAKELGVSAPYLSDIEKGNREPNEKTRFFQTKYLGGKVGGIVLSGYASVIPLFSEFIEAKTNVPTVKGNPWQFVRTSPAQQQALMNVASEFAVAIGLSERSND